MCSPSSRDPKPEIALSRASELAEKAQRLDPSLHQVYFVEGLLALFRRNYEAAIGSTDHAISIKPSLRQVCFSVET